MLARGEQRREASLRPPVPLDPNTVVQRRADQSGYMAVRAQPNGARVVVSEHTLRDGSSRVVAYTESTRRNGQVTSRVYADGHRVTEAREFRSEGAVGGPQFARFNSGLHAAYLPSGRPLYTERFTTTTVTGVTVRAVQRTTYTTVVSTTGAVAFVPVVRVYPLAVTIGAVDYYGYQPFVYAPGFFVPLYRPFGLPIAVAVGCVMCPPPTVAFQAPVQSYADPMDLVGDNVIADATVADDVPPPVPDADSLASAAPATTATDVEANLPPPPPELLAAEAGGGGPAADVAAVRSSAEQLRERVRVESRTVPGSADGGSPAALQQISLVSGDGVAGAGRAGATPVLEIPEYAREQLRKEVRFDIALQQNKRMLLLPSIVKSDYAKIFVFQAAAPIDVSSVADGEQCTLSGGDLIGFARVPAETDAVVQMAVIAGRAGHCRTNDVVELGASDLQDMLNAFSERVERESKRMTACLSAGGACVRT